MIKKIFLDTSVIGGFFDQEFSNDTIYFFQELKAKKIEILTSDILELEIYKAPMDIIKLYESLTNTKHLQLNNEVRELAELYIKEKVVGRTSLADCQHIAFATVNNADVLISWNFKHIVNLEKIRGYNSINLREGYRILEIRTPKEVFSYGK
jgi:predicted nucleic acid-binding protein